MRQAIAGFVMLFFTGLLVPCAVGQDAPALTNKDVIEMTEGGLPEDTILLSVQTGPANFSTGAQDLIALQKAGVPNAVIKAMIARNGNATPNQGAPGMQVAPIPMPVVPKIPRWVVAIDGDARVDLKIDPHHRESKYNKTTFLFEKSDIHRDFVNNEKSSIRLKSRAPIFEVPLSVMIANPETQVALVKFDVHEGKGARSVISATETELDNSSNNPLTVLTGALIFKARHKKDPKFGTVEGAVPFALTQVSDIPGMDEMKIFHLSPESELEPGEYAVSWQGNYFSFGIDLPAASDAEAAD